MKAKYHVVRRPVRRCDQRGLTLIELMITIAVLAIIVGVALPSFNDATLGSRLASYANNLVAGASLARGEAIKRNRQIAMCVSSNGTTCATSGGWEQGWIVINPESGEVILRQDPVPAGFRITAADGFTRVNFQPTGVGVTYEPAAPTLPTLLVCRATPSAGSQERVVTLAATGRASVARNNAGSCP